MNSRTLAPIFALFFLLLTANMAFAANSFDGYYRSKRPADCFEDSFTHHTCQVEQGLNIKRRNKDSYSIWLHTEGDYGHFCLYKEIGHLRNSTLVSEKNDCKIIIQVEGDEASVRASGQGCSANYCGKNVYLDITDLKRH